MGVMAKGIATIARVAPKKKGYDKRKSLRLSAGLNDDLALLAELHHRSANDEAIVAIETHIESHASELREYKRRKR